MTRTMKFALILCAAFISLAQAQRKEVKNYTNANLSARPEPISLFSGVRLTKEQLQFVLESITTESFGRNQEGVYTNFKRSSEFQAVLSPVNNPRGPVESGVATRVRLDAQRAQPDFPQGVTLAQDSPKPFESVAVILDQGGAAIRFSIGLEYVYQAILGPTNASLEDAKIVGYVYEGSPLLLTGKKELNSVAVLFRPQLQEALRQVFNQLSAKK